MAGSYGHVFRDDGSYRGQDLVDDSGRDKAETIDELAWLVRWSKRKRRVLTPSVIKEALEQFYACERGEQPWPKDWPYEYIWGKTPKRLKSDEEQGRTPDPTEGEYSD